ncbi:MAG TPA: hybrid sensor histidine kinase/response regulator [Ottowia sp.]|uniref:ATP-binding response regulator n=1 Tax=Ottowia sp. TaxID=1898956 RepID=UPI002B7141ED|nr:hybrid sensor histidine kinase/response regulator [Ottowia sp.]HMN21843.1 hybrid sensor histidine kinase/response regulator [Ottowia sp.]
MRPHWLKRLDSRLMFTATAMSAAAGPDPTRRLQLEQRMLSLLGRGMLQVQWSSAFIGPALALWLTAPRIGMARAGIPALMLWLLSVARVWQLQQIARERTRVDDAPRRWGRRLAWRSFAAGLVIALWCHFVIESGDQTLVSSVLALVTILSAGAAAQYACWPPVMWSAITPIMLGMAVQLAWHGGTGSLVQALFAAIFWLVVGLAGLRFARTLHSETLMRLDNENLMRALSERHAQLTAASSAKGRFFAAASHDLRQPLQAMGLYLSVLKPGAPIDASTLERLRQCVGSMDWLLEDLLELSRLDEGQLVPVPRAFALQPLLERMAAQYEAQARQKHLQLRVHATSAWVRSDPLLLERALSNLLVDAIRYTRRGGVLLGARRHGDRVRLCVIDTGIGIAAQAQERIYEEFVQLDNPDRDPAAGYGLGLPTVRRIARLLEHPLTLTSKVGRGSVFALELPLAAPELPAAEPPAPEDPTRLHGRVLVVEDNVLVREALVRMLEGWGLVVVQAATGDEALARIADPGVDAVLSDWRLPGPIDGVAVLDHARRHLPQLRLALLLTGEDSQVIRDAGPPYPVLRKPVRPLRLRMQLAQALQSAAAELESESGS